MTAVMFAVQGNRTMETQFFAKMVTASYENREYGHTGQGFSYLWGALGANAGGPAAVAAFFKEASWHFDLVRRCDGSFTYDGGEQYGPGKTDDNTYYGNSGYYGLSPTATLRAHLFPAAEEALHHRPGREPGELAQQEGRGRGRGFGPLRRGPQEKEHGGDSWPHWATGRRSSAAGRRKNWPSVPRRRRWCPN